MAFRRLFQTVTPLLLSGFALLISNGCELKKSETNKRSVAVPKAQPTSSEAFADANQPAVDAALDFQAPPNLEQLAEAQLVETLKSEAYSFMTNNPEAEMSDSSDCFSQKMEALLAKGNDKQLSIAGKADLSSCMKADLGAEAAKYEIISFLVDLRLDVQCSVGGLASFIGKPISALPQLGGLCANGILSYRSIYAMKTGRKTGSGIIPAIEHQVSYDEINAQEDGKLCIVEKKDDKAYLKDGCVIMSCSKTSKYVEDGVSKLESSPSQYLKRQSIGVIMKNDTTSQWPLAGSYAVQLADWQGMVNTRGTDIPPTFEMKKGTLTVNGDLSPGEFEPLTKELALTRAPRRDPLKVPHVPSFAPFYKGRK